MKREQGSITIIVFATVIFILIVLGTTLTAITYKRKSQAVELEELKEIYSMEGETKLKRVYNETALRKNMLDGSGTEGDPYKIYTIEDLVRFSNRTNAGDNFNGKYVELMNTLDFNQDASYENPNRIDYGDVNGNGEIETLKVELTTGKGWPCISQADANAFAGTFDGNDNEIRNIYINNSIAANNLGLFTYVGDCTIKNLGVTGNVSTSIKANMGTLLGRIKTNSTCNLNNCYNKGTVVSSSQDYSIGGLCGNADTGTLNATSCYNEGRISGGNNAGGIVGYLKNTVNLQNCYNTGDVSCLGTYSGGLVGRDNESTSSITISNSYNTGEITNSENIAGGILGRSSGTFIISNSHNNGIVTGKISSGGIVGQAAINTNTNRIIRNSYNEGDISTTSAANDLTERTYARWNNWYS